jgi:hypothetical protein
VWSSASSNSKTRTTPSLPASVHSAFLPLLRLPEEGY